MGLLDPPLTPPRPLQWCNARATLESPGSKLPQRALRLKMVNLISCEPLAHISDIKLIRTDTVSEMLHLIFANRPRKGCPIARLYVKWGDKPVRNGSILYEIDQVNRTTSIYRANMQTPVLRRLSDASIVNSSIERKVTPMGSVLQFNPITPVTIGSIGEEALRLGISNTKTLL
ncbi:hypothetical protein WN944_016002 [Citrus x changshan-huyou]|uniref:Uncharacterized protein n=1 Tax=Citrus x changshan-huyou TaxID=2935761 RepID=A0AAP0MB60_9ROSI